MTEHGLRERKTLNLTTAIDALTAGEGDKVTLDAEQAQATVVALTDVRLLLGERLDLRTDEDADALEERLNQADDTDPFLHLAAYYDFLTWLQESLAQALMD
jgi:transcriptional regulator of acetoin/glycerol metabolism